MANNLFFAESHEWIRVDGDEAYIGISDYAQKELGDIVYVELPEVGAKVTAGESFGTIEAVKAVEDLNSPASGEIIEVNTELEDHPEMINQSPLDEGWIIKIKISDVSELEELLDEESYNKMVEE